MYLKFPKQFKDFKGFITNGGKKQVFMSHKTFKNKLNPFEYLSY